MNQPAGEQAGGIGKMLQCVCRMSNWDICLRINLWEPCNISSSAGLDWDKKNIEKHTVD